MEKNTFDLKAMYETRQDHMDKLHYFEERYENGTLSEEAYKSQTDSLVKTIDTTDKMIENEIKKQGLSEQEAYEIREEVQQERNNGKDR